MTYMLPCNIFEYVLIYTLEYPAACSLFANIGTHMATLTFMTHTIFDHGASEQLGQVLAQHGITRPLLCTDKGLVDLGMVTDLAAKLGNDAGLTIFNGFFHRHLCRVFWRSVEDRQSRVIAQFSCEIRYHAKVNQTLVGAE